MSFLLSQYYGKMQDKKCLEHPSTCFGLVLEKYALDSFFWNQKDTIATLGNSQQVHFFSLTQYSRAPCAHMLLCFLCFHQTSPSSAFQNAVTTLTIVKPSESLFTEKHHVLTDPDYMSG